MKLLVMSDSHGAEGMLELVARHIEKNAYDYIIHLGDVRRDAQWLEDRLGREIMGVAGNCDFLSQDAREIVTVFGGARMLFTHGDAYGVKRSYDRLSYYAEEKQCKAAFFGHTHQFFAGKAGSVMLVNPGALQNGCCVAVAAAAGEIEIRKILL